MDRNIAILFVAAAERDAEANRRGAKPFHTAQSVAADFAEELEPLMQAIAALPEKDGVRFSCTDGKNPGDGVDKTLTMTTDGPVRHGFVLRASAIIRGGLYISIGHANTDDQGSSSYQEVSKPESFHEVRERLATWFAAVAPERIDDLKEILLPDNTPPSMALENAVYTAGPLRLKPSR